jgi:hypothetical protein
MAAEASRSDRGSRAAAAKSDDVNASVATPAGHFTPMSLQPAPPGLPTVRAFQAAHGEITRRWLAERTSETVAASGGRRHRCAALRRDNDAVLAP